MSIIGKVTTNLDGYENEKWPSVFVEEPKVGSYIKSKSGKMLKVSRIIHSSSSIKTHPDSSNKNVKEVPCIEIEVNKHVFRL